MKMEEEGVLKESGAREKRDIKFEKKKSFGQGGSGDHKDV